MDGTEDQTPAYRCHPEEMNAVWEMRIGKSITLQSRARVTPAGILAVGIATSAVLLAISAIIRARRS
ncbi:hypothetical protein [Ancylobacter pratisalsi]|uniref:Uncharacterized protein n=1 Tax=Ancylobacter pratisalsi TaxID=1745854 RepID=A0A6P1YQP7_9HYPH|nr:hypothetical protein [Ancylobacter pratisalsi]QIB35797.1 hypothetical protein G3A50_20345 [Ancylobacter pratisalsi]